MSPPTRKTRHTRVVVFLVYKTTRCISGSRVHVFVTAPCSKIGIPIVQIEFDVSGSVRQIKTNISTYFVPSFYDSCHVKNLSGIIIDTPKKYQSQFVADFFNFGNDVFQSDVVFSFSAFDFDDSCRWIKPMVSNLRLKHVLIGRKSLFFADDFISFCGRTIK